MRPDFQGCLAFINSQMQPTRSTVLGSGGATGWRAVTISRQAGTGGSVVAGKLGDILRTKTPSDAAPWTVFDRNLVERVLEDHQLPARLARFMPENRISEIEDILDDLFGLHPPMETLVRDTAETILQLAELGHVILVGRGANIVTAKRNDVFHVRLVGSFSRRADFMEQSRALSKSQAVKLVQELDRGRRLYVKKYYHASIDDPLLYHLVINTDFLNHEAVARLIAEAVLTHPKKF